jgi:hypothetical protein
MSDHDLFFGWRPGLPPCCTPQLPLYAPSRERLAERCYTVYNAGGDPATAGLNFQGKPCPVWAELPENVKAKWLAVADDIQQLSSRDKVHDTLGSALGGVLGSLLGNGALLVPKPSKEKP